MLPPTKNLPENFHVLLFTGHMIDRSGRETPRFPAEKEAEAKKAIQTALETELDRLGLETTPESIIGIAGGACGGDILFHEACERLHIPTFLFLLFPRDQFIATSVSFAGKNWVDRFNAIYCSAFNSDRVFTQDSSTHVPFSDTSDYSVWQRNNKWMLDNALAYGGKHVTLVALWDREGSKEPGGTADMVQQAENQGAHTVIIDTKAIFGLNTLTG